MSTRYEPALCCGCGTMRSVSAQQAGRGTDERHPDGRCLVILKCATCKAMTRHAVIRNDEHRDYAEQIDRRRDKWRARLTSRLSRLEAAGWEVVWHEPGEVGVNPNVMARLSQWFNGPILLTRVRLDARADPEDLWEAVTGFELWADDIAAGVQNATWRTSSTGNAWRGCHYEYPERARRAGIER